VDLLDELARDGDDLLFLALEYESIDSADYIFHVYLCQISNFDFHIVHYPNPTDL
jgi:hypothetical protein